MNAKECNLTVNIETEPDESYLAVVGKRTEVSMRLMSGGAFLVVDNDDGFVMKGIISCQASERDGNCAICLSEKIKELKLEDNIKISEGTCMKEVQLEK